ncbi:melanopsin-B-like [Actinia tenebrosa]|uniref:Melanopsin-B-like n=1 Tax=Actinia tenebrosa TaxID=6105 RepID=A0A6P8IR94_ACTTE|nr:melanopsin-B-like [Actinia tenebrosa]XP_031568786.1 melanopsin-B-like [Actinia tenebrosa]XP_031568787.1 melanopsin-B-like [Actinia tenebrosa]XP_031568788.1 melanopsin-B-like [Actinia tenebrosa]XP_031568789.1 melanopsin-B-like [Actinia tenebrosa]XP_031568790.1 melanopsin-B-like [Actinia tenebrosa]XP_031568791.1 melanopsin-B-like [Actinia tenebrosa]XP_031568792.1 melanopsin-B-like [Actinia tenebrosa]XP_031568794.1 melanopsin-B-like [Actinia tenebrosa]
MATTEGLEAATEEFHMEHQKNVTNGSLFLDEGGHYMVLEPQPFRWVLRLIFISVFLVGSVGNLVVCSAILRRKRMQTSNNIFTFNLAVSDLMIVLIYLPSQMAAFENNHNWPFGYFGCQFAYIIIPVCLSASIATLLAITSDRYRAIAYPMKPKLGAKSIRLILLSIWVISLLVALPLVFVAGTVRPEPGQVYCDEEWPKPIYGEIYWISIFVIQYILPLCIIWVLAVLIALKLRRNSLQMIERTSHVLAAAFRQRMKQSSKITNMLIALIILYAICMLPQHLVYLFSIYGDLSKFKYRVYVIRFANVFPMANSALNPIAYGTLNKEFKAVFKNFFKCECHKDVPMEDSIHGQSHFDRGRRLRLAVYRHVDDDGNTVVNNYGHNWRRKSSAASLFAGLFQRSKRGSGRERKHSRESMSRNRKQSNQEHHKTNGNVNNNQSSKVATDSIIDLMDHQEKSPSPKIRFQEPKKYEMERLIPTRMKKGERILENSSRVKKVDGKNFCLVEKDKRPNLCKMKRYDENDSELKQCLLCSQSSTESNATRESEPKHEHLHQINSCTSQEDSINVSGSLEWDPMTTAPPLVQEDKMASHANQNDTNCTLSPDSQSFRNRQNVDLETCSPHEPTELSAFNKTNSGINSTNETCRRTMDDTSENEKPDVTSNPSDPANNSINSDNEWLTLIESVQETTV